MRVLQLASEAFPLIKTGGLADVVGALPAAMRAGGADVRLLLPGFKAVLDALGASSEVAPVAAPWGGGGARLLRGELAPWPGVTAYVLRDDAMYLRPGGPYADADQVPWPDNHRRFALLAWAAAQLARGMDPAWQPEVLHAHDWHTGLMPAYLRYSGATGVRSVFTVHNLAYQGVFPQATFAELGLPHEAWSMHGVEFHGQVSFMKAGLHFADAVTTVSPTYARELLGAEQGAGLDGVLRARPDGVHGVLNGVDAAVWNPASDPHIAKAYGADRPAGKAVCKAALQTETGLAVDPKALLFGVVSRLTEQKGLHLVLDSVDEILRRGGQLVVLGSGDRALETAFQALAKEHPQSIALRTGFDEPLAHRIYAGIDVVMVPSRFEPCGLTQLYGLTYGALPLVHRVGGLADTVVDVALENLHEGTATGFVFDHFDTDGCRRAVQRAFALRARTQDWQRVRKIAMQQSFGWDVAARMYLELYQGL
jgi:starch synthase